MSTATITPAFGTPEWFKWREARIAAMPKPSAEDIESAYIRVLPAGWQIAQEGADGTSYINKSQGIFAILSVSVEQDGKTWLHLSVSRSSRLPSYDDLLWCKSIFIGDKRKAVQVFPPKSEHINIHPYVLHLWACLAEDPLPDFTHGSGSI